VKSLRISLRVSGIIWSSCPKLAWPGWAPRTDKNAQASRARMVQRCQEVQVRTWVLVERGEFLAGREAFFDLPPRSGHPHQLCQRYRPGSVSAVEGQLAISDAAADQQPVRPGAIGCRGIGGVDQGPVIPARSLGAGPGR
jgi:hypothetical protein